MMLCESIIHSFSLLLTMLTEEMKQEATSLVTIQNLMLIFFNMFIQSTESESQNSSKTDHLKWFD